MFQCVFSYQVNSTSYGVLSAPIKGDFAFLKCGDPTLYYLQPYIFRNRGPNQDVVRLLEELIKFLDITRKLLERKLGVSPTILGSGQNKVTKGHRRSLFECICVCKFRKSRMLQYIWHYSDGHDQMVRMICYMTLKIPMFMFELRSRSPCYLISRFVMFSTPRVKTNMVVPLA